MSKLKRFSLSHINDLMYLITALAIFVASVLTVLSFLELCSSECAEGHKYRLFGLPFEAFGALFFVSVTLLHLFQRNYPSLKFYELLLFASALGAEIMFILVQKYQIGAWCPVCLGIASSVAIGFGAQAIDYNTSSTTSAESRNKGERMNFIWKGLPSVTAIFFGFLIAFIGISEFDALEAAQDTVEERLAFGNVNSNIEVYLFTDWACPACRKLENHLETIVNSLKGQAKIIFVDHAVHPETLNFVPYHLSFILKNRDHYFELRNMLTEISKRTGSPTEAEVTQAAAKHGVQYSELNYSDIAFAIKYYKQLGDKFKIEGTPTMVIINTETKKGKKLAGLKEITEENAQKAIARLTEK